MAAALGTIYESGIHLERIRRLLHINGVRRSMGQRATCYDNTVAKSFFAIYKKELIPTRRLIHKPHKGRASVSLIVPWPGLSSQLLYNLRMACVALEGQRPLPFCSVVGQTAKSKRRSRFDMRL